MLSKLFVLVVILFTCDLACAQPVLKELGTLDVSANSANGVMTICRAGSGSKNDSDPVGIAFNDANTVFFYNPANMTLYKSLQIDETKYGFNAYCFHHPTDPHVYIVTEQAIVFQLDSEKFAVGEPIDVSDHICTGEDFHDYTYGNESIYLITTFAMVQFSLPDFKYMSEIDFSVVEEQPLCGVTLTDTIIVGMKSGRVYFMDLNTFEMNWLEDMVGSVTGVYPFFETGHKASRRLKDPAPWDTDPTFLSVVGTEGIGLVELDTFEMLAVNSSAIAQGMTPTNCQDEALLYVVQNGIWNVWDFEIMKLIASFDGVKVSTSEPHACYFSYSDMQVHLGQQDADTGKPSVIKAELQFP